MEKFIINPENYQADYIKNLNECFNGWGGERQYHWGLERKVGEYSTDILLIENEEDGVIAGSAVSYRKLSGANKEINIGIMTGSWTLPAARRKGCFTKMINCSRDLCREKNIPFLTAFVTEANASSRRLESEGSFMFPTYHLFSPQELYKEDDLPHIEIQEKSEDLKSTLFETVLKRQNNSLNFSYSFEEFLEQYVNRIKDTSVLKINGDFAILENGINEVKILLLTFNDKETFKLNLKAVTNWCLKNRNKKAFYFTTQKELLDASMELNFENLPGFFTILRTTDNEVSYEELFNSLNINMADKM